MNVTDSSNQMPRVMHLAMESSSSLVSSCLVSLGGLLVSSGSEHGLLVASDCELVAARWQLPPTSGMLDAIQYNQLQSITINSCQLHSITVKYNQLQPITVNCAQLLSGAINYSQLLSITIYYN